MAGTTRERILDVAWDLFVKHGFAGTTVTQIEAAASLSPGSGSFYRHFRSKDDVLEAVVEREVERIAAVREIGPELDETDGDVRIALALEFQRRLGNLRRIHPLMLLVGREREHLGKAGKSLQQLLVDQNVAVRSQRIAAWMDAGAIPAGEPEAVAATVMCALVGYHLSLEFFGRPPTGVTEETFVTTLVDLVTGTR